MLPIELMVRIEPGAGSAFGSGILIGQSHVLTCAHVVDPDYSKADYADPDGDPGALSNINDGAFHNAELSNRMARRFVDVIPYDGITRKASLLAVHANEDLALLRLSTPAPYAVRIPQFQTDYEATNALPAAGLGFRRTRANAYSIRCETLTLTASDSAVFAARGSTFHGQASEGMSGGPVMMEFAGGRLKIAAMLTKGGSTQASCGVIRADTLLEFLKSHLGEEAFAPQGNATFGLTPELQALSGRARTATRWIPLPKTKRDGDGYGYNHIRFIASRPLTFADLDAVTGYRVKQQNRLNREGFFAPVTIDEASEVVRLFTERLGERFSIPDRKAQDSLQPPSDINGGAVGRHHLADHARPELVLAPEWDSRRYRPHDGAIFPAAGVPEWIVDDGRSRLAFADPERPGWDITALPGSLAQKSYKALLRPVLTIPVWTTAQ
ncbi:serine protease [Rhizobium sp. RU36D]|uniref:trypsin-like serine peptidase n=1 Tax=Rhizobium sp. RU36D TaxID=1907415 RepID=UPI0009D8A435|nr:serine protease [Rhizobium sp. RU36D]SMC75926.1 Trypsin-like peptidase domain-containing protein [Rhizobium sp. RU36D]